MKNENALSALLYVTKGMRIMHSFYVFKFSVKSVIADYAHLIAYVASVSVRFRNKERATRIPFLGLYLLRNKRKRLLRRLLT